MAEVSPSERVDEIERRISKMVAKRDLLNREIAEAEADVKALRRVDARNLLADRDAQSEDEPGDFGSRHGHVRERVVSALKRVPQDFTIRDLEPFLCENGNEAPDQSSISKCLSRLKDDGVIEETNKGKGRRPTRFRRKEPPV